MSKTSSPENEAKFLHDISTPLSIILFQIESAMKSKNADDVQKRLLQALEQTKKVVASLEARRERLKTQD